MPFSFRWPSWTDDLLHAKRYDEALARATKILQRHARRAEEWARKGAALYFLGRNEEAASAFAQARSISPNVGYWGTEQRALHALKCHDQALAVAQQALKYNRSAAWAWNDVGYALHMLGRDEEALPYYSDALARDRTNAYMWINAAIALNTLKRYDETVELCERARRAIPNPHSLWQHELTALFALHRFEDAYTRAEQSLALNPKAEWAWINFGQRTAVPSAL